MLARRKWFLLPPLATHVVLGVMFAFSMLLGPLSSVQGVVAAAPTDLDPSKVLLLFSGLTLLHGCSAAAFSLWQERVGLRGAAIVGGSLFTAGFVTAGAAGCGIFAADGAASFPALFLGYGVLTGLALGASYVPPLAAAVRWFPDRTGLASGLTSMGFGGGALVASPLKAFLLSKFATVPTCAGSAAALTASGALQTAADGTRMLTQADGSVVPVVVPSAADIGKLTGSLAEALPDHVYLIGTGSTGVGPTLITMGVLYGAIIIGCGLVMRLPPPDWPATVARLQGTGPPAAVAAAAPDTAGGADGPGSSIAPPAPTSILDLPKCTGTVTATSALRTPQFWQVWTMMAALASAGMAVLSVAKTFVNEVFGSAYPTVVTASFAAAYVMGLSAANLSGRVAYGSLSDTMGRKKMFALFAALLIPLYAAIPTIAQAALVPDATLVPLVAFIGVTGIAVSMFGAAYSCTPPYESDLFGPRFVGAIHGRMLTASAAAGTLGPSLLSYLYGRSTRTALEGLYAVTDHEAFRAKFGVDLTPEAFWALVESKTITIGSLLDVCAPGTIDPTPFLYNSSMYAASGLALVALIANLTVRPVATRHLLK